MVRPARLAFFAVLTTLALPAVLEAQVSDITEIRLDRQHSMEFVELYAEMANAMEAGSTDIKPVSKNLLAHSWAGDVAFIEIVTYATMADLRADFNTDPAKIRAYAETLSEEDREAFGERVARYFSLFLEGHTDETRTWVQDWGWNYDPVGHESHAHVVTRSKYDPTYANVGEFMELYAETLLPAQDDHPGIMVTASRHTTGSGATVDIWTVYESWSDFAEFMEGGDGGDPPDEAQMARMFEIEGPHDDDIFVRVGTMNRAEDGTAEFTIAGN
jgi:hypothetical protein